MKKNWFNQTVKEVEKELQTDLEKGLATEKVQEYTQKFGLNELQEKRKNPFSKNF